MNDYLEKIKSKFQENPMLTMGIGAVVVILLGFWLFAPDHSSKDTASTEETKSAVGITLGDSEKLEYMKGLEKNYYDFEDRMKAMENQIKDIKNLNQQFKKDQQEILAAITQLKETTVDKDIDRRSSSVASFELAIAPVKDLAVKDDVYLPLGSFCKGTLLTGVYASTDLNSPLPVLISLDEAFYGPNKTRIPLKGAFVLGKAFGDINSQRALIQIVAISFVLPNGNVFEHEQDIGYVTDEFGELGIRGQVVRNTGKALALTFMGGFMSGGAAALADSETTTERDRLGTQTNITGDVSKHALFSGLAKSSGDLSEYYQKQAENIIPAVHVGSGKNIYFIVQKGVRIDGLLRPNFNQLPNIN